MYACGTPRFWNSMVLTYGTDFPYIPETMISLIKVFSFILKLWQPSLVDQMLFHAEIQIFLNFQPVRIFCKCNQEIWCAKIDITSAHRSLMFRGVPSNDDGKMCGIPDCTPSFWAAFSTRSSALLSISSDFVECNCNYLLQFLIWIHQPNVSLPALMTEPIKPSLMVVRAAVY